MQTTFNFILKERASLCKTIQMFTVRKPSSSILSTPFIISLLRHDKYSLDNYASQTSIIRQSNLLNEEFISEKDNLQNLRVKWSKLSQQHPQNEAYEIMLGNSFILQNNYEETLKHYQQALKINPTNADTYNNLGILLHHKKDQFSAIRFLEMGIQKDCNNYKIYHNLAIIYMQIGNYTEAAQNLVKSYKLNPNLSNHFIQNGRELFEKQHFAAALPFLAKVFIHKSDNQYSMKTLKRAFLKSQKIEQAKQFYAVLLQENQFSKTANQSLAMLLFESGNINQAKEYLEIGLQNENNNEIRLCLATAYLKEGDIGRAINLYEECAKKDPSSSTAFTSLGMIYMQQNQKEKSLECYSKALSVNSRDEVALNGLANICIMNGQIEQGIMYLRNAIAIDEDNYPALERLADILYLLGKEEESNHQLQLATSIKKRLNIQ